MVMVMVMVTVGHLIYCDTCDDGGDGGGGGGGGDGGGGGGGDGDQELTGAISHSYVIDQCISDFIYMFMQKCEC